MCLYLIGESLIVKATEYCRSVRIEYGMFQVILNLKISQNLCFPMFSNSTELSIRNFEQVFARWVTSAFTTKTYFGYFNLANWQKFRSEFIFNFLHSSLRPFSSQWDFIKFIYLLNVSFF